MELQARIEPSEEDAVVRDGPTSRAWSFEEFYEREYPAIVRLAYALTGHAGQAEEFAQDAFLAAYRRWNVVGSYDWPDLWIRRVAANASRSGLRRRAAELRALARLSGRAVAVEVDADSEGVWAAIRRLPGRQAQVLALTAAEERSVAEIAEILNCGEETVRTHLRRGRTALARLLRVEGDDA